MASFGVFALYIFTSLKDAVRERITTDPDTRDEYTNIDKLVAEAKMIDVAVFARTGKWKDGKGKRRERSRSPDSRRGKKAPHHGRGGGGRGERRQQPAEPLLSRGRASPPGAPSVATRSTVLQTALTGLPSTRALAEAVAATVAAAAAAVAAAVVVFATVSRGARLSPLLILCAMCYRM